MTEAHPIELSIEAETIAERIKTELVAGQIDVPLLPEVARKVLEIVNDPDSDVAQLANTIQGDQALAAHVVRIANSPAYSATANIVSLQQAISRLGMNLMSEIAMAASLDTHIFNAPGYEQKLEELWDFSLMVGLWTREIARQSRKNVEAAFLCGLLHGIGRPVVLQRVAEINSPILPEETNEIERRLLTEANSVVMEKWRLPGLIQQAIISYAGDIESLTDTALLIRGGIIFSRWMASGDDSTLSRNDHGEILARLNLYPEDIDQLKTLIDDVKTTKEAMRG